MVTVGVLGLQGGVEPHLQCLESLGINRTVVRRVSQLDGVDGLILPGGESTTIGKLLVQTGLGVAIVERIEADSLALMGTCAGMIVSARSILDGLQGQLCLGVFDAQVRRNGIGRQQQSHQVPVQVKGVDRPLDAVFIRPPVVESVGPEVEVLATYQASPVLCAQDRHLFATFHPELSGDAQVHKMFRERL